MSTTYDTGFELFTRAALSDEDLGYPNRVIFVPIDVDDVDGVVWRSLHNEQRPVVLVGRGDAEVLIVPCARGRARRVYESLRGYVTVRVGWRRHGLHDDEYSVRTRVGHRPVADLHQPITC